MKITGILALVLVLTACNATDGGTQQQGGSSLKSGIEGTVTIGPTCPVQRLDDPSCDDRPYQGIIHVSGTNPNSVTTFKADAQGHFKIELEPGNYTLEPQTPMEKLFPRPANQDVAVVAGAFTMVRIQYDSGLR